MLPSPSWTFSALIWLLCGFWRPTCSFLRTPLPSSRLRLNPVSTTPGFVSARFQTARGAAGGDFFDEISESLSDDNEDNQNEGDDPRRMTREELKASMGEWDDRVPKLNIVTLVGRVGNDPDPRYFDDGKVVLNLSLAVKRKYHPLERKARNIQSGEEETDWFPLEIWGRDAEYASKYVDKGARIGVTGSLQVDHWTDRNTGEPRQRPKIIVRHLDILESRAEGELRRQNRRGPSFYTSDNDDDDEDDGPSPAGTGGFFD